jgi:hypothetical protein
VPLSGINQTSFLFGALAFAFVFFVTVRGDLPKWLGLLGLAGGSSAPAGTGAALPAAQNPFAGIPALPGLAAGNMT